MKGSFAIVKPALSLDFELLRSKSLYTMDETLAVDHAQQESSLSLPVEGMTCASCVARLDKALMRKPGVISARVNLASERADVDFDTTVLDPVQIAEIISKAGFSVPLETTELAIEGMTCASCSGRIEKALMGLDGVVSAQANLASETVSVAYPAQSLSVPALIGVIEKAGYDAKKIETGAVGEQDEDEKAAAQSHHNFLVFLLGAVLSLPLVGQMAWQWAGIDWAIPGVWQLALATPVQFVAGARFYRPAWRALLAGSGNMDLLVVLGTSAAYGLSTLQVFHPLEGTGAHLYFEASAAVITLVLLGRWMETRAKRGTTQAIRALMNLRPETARVLRNGQEEEIPAENVKSGDKVVVRPGERIPVDGTIFEGASQIDESLLTGESMPVSKGPNDLVTGGSINGEGLLRIEATTVGAQSALSKIIKLIQNAQASKAPVQNLVDRIAAIFVPIVVVIAVATFIGWQQTGLGIEGAIINAVAVLVIACPCSLGLATPTAIMVGTGVAARHGILIKDADALEKAYRVDTVIFDKTGTLTEGRPKIIAIVSSDEGEGEETLLHMAASAQQGSEHPLARAVLERAEELSLDLMALDDFTARAGKGLIASFGARTLAIGNRRLMKEEGIPTKSLEDEAVAFEKAGRTVMWVAEKEPKASLYGIIAVGDRIKEDALPALEALQKKGIETIMLTGDNARSAAFVAEQLGVDKLVSEVLPEDKANEVERLKKAGKSVAMVGDGVNDAPALAAADVGIAMGSGSDVAMHTAGITLMRSTPTCVSEALGVSRATFAKIRQNLFWAFIYNIIGIPLAAAGLLNPVIAGGAMAMSSVSVVSNSLLLKRWAGAK
jgi:P-type Cu+ transporter